MSELTPKQITEAIDKANKKGTGESALGSIILLQLTFLVIGLLTGPVRFIKNTWHVGLPVAAITAFAMSRHYKAHGK